MKVLVTGSTGFVGKAVVRRLRGAGHEVRAAVRRPGGSPTPQVVAVGDICGSADWREALEGIDVVVHLAARAHVMKDTADGARLFTATNAEGTLRLAEAMRQAGVRRMVFMSTIKVNGESTTGTPFHADDLPAPADPYAVSKYEAEQGLLRMPSLDPVIIRPPLVYGPGVKGNLARFCRLADLGMPVPFGAIDNRRDLVGVDNLADLVAACVTHPAAARQVFLAADGVPLSTPRLYAMIAESMGRSPRMLRVSPDLLNRIGRWVGLGAELQRLTGSLEIDLSGTRRALDWSPPVAPEAGIAAMTAAYRAGTERD
jgi:nucleoside-diphosphate-sugar epimerase